MAGIFDLIGQALPGLFGGLLTKSAYEDLGNIGQKAYRESGDIARQTQEMARFKPFTVTSSTGGQFMAGPEGQYQLATSPQEQALQQQLFGGAGQFYQQAMQPQGQRVSDVYERIRAVQTPEEERQRLGLEQRLASQGRLGVRTSQFGGTPEQLALATAQEQARNEAALSAIQQAQAEQMQQANLGQGFLASSYVPQAQLLNAIQPGLTTAEQARQSQLYGAGQYGEGMMSGLQALLSSGLGQSDLYGRLGTGLLSGFFTPYSQGGGSVFTDILKEIPNIQWPWSS